MEERLDLTGVCRTLTSGTLTVRDINGVTDINVRNINVRFVKNVPNRPPLGPRSSRMFRTDINREEVISTVTDINREEVGRPVTVPCDMLRFNLVFRHSRRCSSNLSAELTGLTGASTVRTTLNINRNDGRREAQRPSPRALRGLEPRASTSCQCGAGR